MNSIFVVALAGFTEARRNRVTLIVVAFALVMLLATSTVLSITVLTLDRVATDFGLGVMSMLMVALAIFLSSTQLSREIDRRTVFLVLSRPLSRAQFVVGRMLGTVLTLWAMLAGMAALFFAQAAVLHMDITEAQYAAVGGLAAELVVLAALGALLSSVSGIMLASLASVGIYLIGHGSSDLWELATRSKSPVMQTVGKGLYWVLPQLSRLDYKPLATYALPVDWGQFGVSVGYAFAYAAVLAVVAIVVFERVDFK